MDNEELLLELIYFLDSRGQREDFIDWQVERGADRTEIKIAISEAEDY